ncbi:MAG: hypothetical protein P0Y49_17295 [Candidatus Pedobacter colombiensis]|uniref:DUF4136 domain-containing protein n=1 Tax=Candidatus Pedobacter colombiensis TaxID=3121371 RepID=A0AAJ5W4V0_9SPHI|nr:hypothetical protein [Pedobacter sp.]WEK18548.1 MAG: hypothetical protein P0Y49_17295 [Pedobacter sp.]
MKKVNFFAILLISGILWSCSPATRVTGSWVSSSARGTMLSGRTVFIASLTRNMEVRTKLENAWASQAAVKGVKVVKSTEYFSPDYYQKLPSERELLSRIQNSGANYILTISLINKESETRYVPGSMGYAPYPYYGWYGGFYSYYNYWRPMFYDPGYYVTDKKYFLETNLYSMDDNKLVWSAQTETVNPASIDNFANSYPKILINQMVKDGLLPM